MSTDTTEYGYWESDKYREIIRYVERELEINGRDQANLKRHGQQPFAPTQNQLDAEMRACWTIIKILERMEKATYARESAENDGVETATKVDA